MSIVHLSFPASPAHSQWLHTFSVKQLRPPPPPNALVPVCREAGLLAGNPGGLMLSCPSAPVQTVIKVCTFTVTRTLVPVTPPPISIKTTAMVKEGVHEVENIEPPHVTTAPSTPGSTQ